ncbi:MAG TPA: DUF423 domain-containing protein [Methylocystis sp.]|nr:DUF423 domain-containing protein [Methylocystis sp.]
MSRTTRLIAAIAALQGAAGVTLAAVSAHLDQSPLLATASSFLTVHAAAGLALAALAAAREPQRGLVVATFGLQAGVTLFGLDLALRALGPGRLFPYAAPIGGSLTILAWAGLAVSAAWPSFRRLRDGDQA